MRDASSPGTGDDPHHVGQSGVADTTAKQRARSAERDGHGGRGLAAATPVAGADARAARTGLALLTTLLTVNLVTGGPLLAVWVGSRIQTESTISGRTVLVIIAVLAIVSVVQVYLLHRIGATYARLSGRARRRRTVSYLQSRETDTAAIHVRESTRLNGFERVMIGCVTVAVLGFEIWFFFLSGSSIGPAR